MTMSATPVATNLNETLDIKVDILSKVTLDSILPVNNLPETINLIFGKAIRLGLSGNTGLS
jgi:hypothetical protein